MFIEPAESLTRVRGSRAAKVKSWFTNAAWQLTPVRSTSVLQHFKGWIDFWRSVGLFNCWQGQLVPVSSLHICTVSQLQATAAAHPAHCTTPSFIHTIMHTNLNSQRLSAVHMGEFESSYYYLWTSPPLKVKAYILKLNKCKWMAKKTKMWQQHVLFVDMQASQGMDHLDVLSRHDCCPDLNPNNVCISFASNLVSTQWHLRFCIGCCRHVLDGLSWHIFILWDIPHRMDCNNREDPPTFPLKPSSGPN